MSSEMSLLHFDYNEASEKVLIGQGEYGKIFKSKFNSEFVALKVMDYIDEKDIKKEAKFLAKLNHPNIIQIKGICLTESCIMMEFMWLDLQLYRSINVVHSVNDLLLQLSKPSSHGYDFTILKLAQGILNGLSFLHELGVAQRDLKPSNILVNNPKKTSARLQAKLGHFGESWGNIVEATECMKTHTINVYKG